MTSLLYWALPPPDNAGIDNDSDNDGNVGADNDGNVDADNDDNVDADNGNHAVTDNNDHAGTNNDGQVDADDDDDHIDGWLLCWKVLQWICYWLALRYCLSADVFPDISQAIVMDAQQVGGVLDSAKEDGQLRAIT